MKYKMLSLVGIGLLTVIAAVLLALSHTDYKANLGSVVEIWADVVRDVDHLGLTVTRISAEEEDKIGGEIHWQISQQEQLIKNAVLQPYLFTVGQRLARHVRRKGIEYYFHIIRSPHINAYAVPGGHIYITNSMLAFLESEAELAAILAHEISHVELRHCIERLQYELLARKIVGHDLALIARFGHELMVPAFSEQQEHEADTNGMVLAAKAGYDPGAMLAIMQRMAEVESPPQAHEDAAPTLMVEELGVVLGKALEQYFETHPPMSQRVRDIAAVLERNKNAWRGREYKEGRSDYQEKLRLANIRHEKRQPASAADEIILSDSAKKAFEEYTYNPEYTDFKAFAYDTESGHWGWGAGYGDPIPAMERAARECSFEGIECRVYAVGNYIVAGFSAEELVAAVDAYRESVK